MSFFVAKNNESLNQEDNKSLIKDENNNINSSKTTTNTENNIIKEYNNIISSSLFDKTNYSKNNFLRQKRPLEHEKSCLLNSLPNYNKKNVSKFASFKAFTNKEKSRKSSTESSLTLSNGEKLFAKKEKIMPNHDSIDSPLSTVDTFKYSLNFNSDYLVSNNIELEIQKTNISFNFENNQNNYPSNNNNKNNFNKKTNELLNCMESLKLTSIKENHLVCNENNKLKFKFFLINEDINSLMNNLYLLNYLNKENSACLFNNIFNSYNNNTYSENLNLNLNDSCNVLKDKHSSEFLSFSDYLKY